VCKAAERDYQRARYRRQRGLSVDPPDPPKLNVVDSQQIASHDGFVVEAVRAELNAALAAAERSTRIMAGLGRRCRVRCRGDLLFGVLLASASSCQAQIAASRGNLPRSDEAAVAVRHNIIGATTTHTTSSAVIDYQHHTARLGAEASSKLPPITSDVNGHLGGVKCAGGLELDEQTPIA
jgi:hypothetical protein